MNATRDELVGFSQGTVPRLWELLGAHLTTVEGRDGAAFTVWAPRAVGVSVVGDFNDWDVSRAPLIFDEPSGLWNVFVADVRSGDRYKFAVHGVDGSHTMRADPMARAAELAPSNASLVAASSYGWNDADWMASRADHLPTERRLSIYEVHLGSWRRRTDRPVFYIDIANELADHVTALGFTHVELMPVAEHPYGGSWGYQVTGYYAPTARYGDPDGFRAFIDIMHARGIGVIVDWVPAHFPRDEWALAKFDGAGLYESDDASVAGHPDWGTLVFDLTRPQVRNFLVSNARYWIEEFHIDGLRVDAVASMLYLDYSRAPGEWTPNSEGGREDLDAVAFLREVTTTVRDAGKGVLMVAEESTTWPGVSAPVADGGLGFTHKWNMGWMHDTLNYFSSDPSQRPERHDELSFSFSYAWSERFVLPLSHDEVVHEKRSLIEKMPGSPDQQVNGLRALYAWMWAHPGPKLLFMGGEFGQRREWSDSRELDWELLDQPEHRGIRDLVVRLNALHAAERALWVDEFTEAGFKWVSGEDRAASVYAFLRLDPTGQGRPVMCVASLGAVDRAGYRVGVPTQGRWEVLVKSSPTPANTSGLRQGQGVASQDVAWHGFDSSLQLDLNAGSVLWLAPLPSQR